jgi:hypothetical protein
MKLCFSDPPYPGQAKRHYSNDPSGIPAEEVDQVELIQRMIRDYDGWAMSTSSPGLFRILQDFNDNYAIEGPEFFLENGIRMASWVKPFCSWKPTHRVQYCWEPVLFKPARTKGGRGIPSCRDFLSANITLRRGTHGCKPDAFNDWILDLIGYKPGDTMDDLFPGTGGMGEAVKRFEMRISKPSEPQKEDLKV